MAPSSTPLKDGGHCEVLTSLSFLASWAHLQTEVALQSGTLSRLQNTPLQGFAPHMLPLPSGHLEGEGIAGPGSTVGI